MGHVHFQTGPERPSRGFDPGKSLSVLPRLIGESAQGNAFQTTRSWFKVME